MDHSPDAVVSPMVLAANLKRLMEATPELRTQQQVADKSGVSQTAISLMLRPDDRMKPGSGKTPSPKLAEVEMVAKAFRLQVWQLLIDKAALAQFVTTALAVSATTPQPPQPSPQGPAKGTVATLTKRRRKGIVPDTAVEKVAGGVFARPDRKLGAKLRREAIIRKARTGPPPEGDLITPPKKEED